MKTKRRWYRVLCGFSGGVISLLLTGCALPELAEESQHREFKLQLEPAETSYARPQLGLALSGGGIRSALFSIGVLKSLYDQGILQKVDLISTVSGGGYAGYWLYSNELSRPAGTGFGAVSLASSNFGRQLCELGTRGNFVTNWNYITPLISPLTTYPEMYEDRIFRSFGLGDDSKRKVSDMHSTGSSTVPYLIVNSTVIEPKPKDGWVDGLFEMTPLHFGNEQLRYRPWANDAPAYRATVGASGAAKIFLKRDFELSDKDGKTLNVILADGGASENLGLIALIRRGVKTIIVADGEHNPNYEFSAYANLQERLPSWGLKLQSDTIDKHLALMRAGQKPPRLATGLHEAKVMHGDKEISHLYYFKMADPVSLDNVLSDQQALAAGEAFDLKYFGKLEQTATPGGAFGKTWHCDQAVDVAGDMESWFKYSVKTYGKFAKTNPMFGLLHSLRGIGDGFLDSNFPQYTTADQSYYLDQNLAYIGLGYLEGNELKPLMPKIMPAELAAK